MSRETTKAALVAMLGRANIAFSVSENEVRVAGTGGPNNEGSEDMYTVFYFDRRGELTGVGVWDGGPPIAHKAEAA